MLEVPEIHLKLKEMKPTYTLLSEVREKAQTPVAKVKELNKEIYTIYGEEAAQKFYDKNNFTRENAMPGFVLKTLFGEGGVQTLEGEEHRDRKKVFMDLMTPERIKEYEQLLDKNMSKILEKQTGQFELFDVARRILFETVIEWCGINLDNLSEEEIEKLSEYQITMISGTFTNPIEHMKAVNDRNKTEKWAQELIKRARRNPEEEEENIPLYAFAFATDLKGELLPVEVAAVELINIIRPTMALTVWAAIMGHALFSRSDIYEALRKDYKNLEDSFIQELRRYYPFFPALPAITVQDVEVDGYKIPKDSFVALDLYGTDHDARKYERPEEFIIDRFVLEGEDLSYEEQYKMIAQGGGNFRSMHRCAGEWITLHTLRTFANHLVNKYNFSVPDQDFEIPMDKFPTYPNDKVILFKQ